MNRRTYLKSIAIGSPLIAGCASEPAPSTTTEKTGSSTPKTTLASTHTLTKSPTESGEKTDTPREDPNTIFVDSDHGSNDNRGTRDAPLGTIQEGLNRAHPGQTVYVLPGRYTDITKTVRNGASGEPITLTGPPDAVFHGGDGSGEGEQAENFDPIEINHSHIHITGLTLDGLLDRENPDVLESYARANVQIMPKYDGDGKPPLLNDIKVKPHAVGNTRGNCVHVFSAENVEVGEFELIGPAGIDHFVWEQPGHDGEVVYIGSAPNGWRKHFNEHVDRTRNVHVHHIDASAGYVHSEIADAKIGTTNVLIEYCTSVGAVSDRQTGGGAGLHLGGEFGVARWNVITRSSPMGIFVGNWGEPDERVPEAGTNNAVYGNRVEESFEKFTAVNSEVKDIALSVEISEEDMIHYCGNEFDGSVDGNPGKPCPEGIPTRDGIGHLGGESPWT